MSYKILLIDSDTEVGERYRTSLLEAGHQLIKAGDARKATEALEKVRPDLALVVEDSGHLAAAALCAHLKKTRRGRLTPFVFLAVEVPGDGGELARRIEQVGCDRMLGHSAPVQQLLEACEQLVSTSTAAATATAPAAPVSLQASAAPSPGSGGSAAGKLQKTDPGNTHPVIGAVGPAAPSSGPPPVPTDNEANRDARSPESFSVSVPAVGFVPTAGDDAGQDIADHLDSLFGGQPAAETPKAAPARPRAEPAPPAPTPPRPKSVTRTPAKQPVTPAPAAKAKPAAPAKPVQPKPVARTRTAPPAAPTPAATPAPKKAPPRETPKAVEQLRLPRVPEAKAPNQGYRRWLPIAAGIAAAAVAIGLLSTVYVVFMRGDETPAVEPTIAQVQEAPEPLPVPPPLATSPFEGPMPVSEETPAPPASPADEPVGVKPGTAIASNLPPAKPVTAPPKPPKAAPKTIAVETKKPVPKPVPKSDAPVKTATVKTTPPPAEKKVEPAAPGAMIAAAAVTPKPPAPEIPSPPVEESRPPEVRTTEEPSAAPPPPVDEPVVEEPQTEHRPGFRPPIVVERFEPEYSPQATRGVDNAVVVLSVLLDESGKIARVNVEQGIPGSELEAAAISAIMRWRFHPATEFGVPVRAWTTARFVFEP